MQLNLDLESPRKMHGLAAPLTHVAINAARSHLEDAGGLAAHEALSLAIALNPGEYDLGKSPTACNGQLRANSGRDMFRAAFEHIFSVEQRAAFGEFYTPDDICDELVAATLCDLETELPILDPACGSGSFLLAAYRLIVRNVGASDAIRRLHGWDTSATAVLMTRTNLLLALPKPDTDDVQVLLENVQLRNAIRRTERPGRFQFVIGNPPWIVLRNIDVGSRQLWKSQLIERDLWNPRDTHIATQLDISAVFLDEALRWWAAGGGRIGMVMPRSVISGGFQHRPLWDQIVRSASLEAVYDLQGVRGLFPMPGCMIVARVGSKTVSSQLWRVLGKRDGDVVHDFEVRREGPWKPPDWSGPQTYSPYHSLASVGLSIFPRVLYFVEKTETDRQVIHVESSVNAVRTGKSPWTFKLKGQVEPEFIWRTILADDLVPFGEPHTTDVVLPLVDAESGPVLIDAERLRTAPGMAAWWAQAEQAWAKHRTPTSSIRFPSLVDRFNYNNILDKLRFADPWAVFYNATGSDISAAPVNVRDRIIIPDVKTWVIPVKNEHEACYLSAILNSPHLNVAMKPLQPHGTGGARAIHRIPLQFPIPEYDSSDSIHRNLVEVAQMARKKVETGRWNRRTAKRELAEEFQTIDSLVTRTLPG